MALRCVIGVFLVAAFVAVASSCDHIDQTDVGKVGEQVSLRCTTCPQRGSVEWYRLFPDGTVTGPIPIENPEESSNLVLPVDDSSIGGRVYYCQCPSKPIECHEILVEPHLTIRASPEVASEGSPLNITCQGEGYPQPRPSDFSIYLHLPDPTLVPLPAEWINHLENGIQVIIPRAVFPDHGGAYSCYADVNVTEFDPNLPIRNPILHGNTRTQVYVYASRGVQNFTAYGTLPEHKNESGTIATIECIIEKPKELSVNWTRGGEVIPRHPNDSGFKYVMAEPFQLEGGSTWVYQLTVRRLSRGDVGEYGCTVYFQGEVEGVVPVWILESELCRDTGSGEPPRNCSDPTTPGEGGTTSGRFCHPRWFILSVVLGAALFLVLGGLAVWYFIYSNTGKHKKAFKDPVQEMGDETLSEQEPLTTL